MTEQQGSTHTPGPWKASSKMEGIHILTAGGVDFAAIEALVPNAEGEANARLMAASPSMVQDSQRKALEGDTEAKELYQNATGQEAKEGTD